MRTVRRFLLGELDGAIAKLETGDLTDRNVHAIRKEFKRVRAALRLLRPCLGSAAYRRENAGYFVVVYPAHPVTVRWVTRVRRPTRGRRPSRAHRGAAATYLVTMRGPWSPSLAWPQIPCGP